MIPCTNPGCREQTLVGHRYCSHCAAVTWRTGRPPELVPAPRLPEWRRRDLAKDMGRAA